MSTIEQPAGPAHGVPVVNDFDPFEHENEAFWQNARQNTPIFYNEQTNAYWLTRYADCDRVLGDRGTHVSAHPALAPNIQPIPEASKIMQESGLVLAPSIVDEDGEEHKKHRRAAQPPFTVNKVQELRDFIRRQVTEKLDAIVKNGQADIVDEMIYDVPGAVILHMMGVPDEQLSMVKGFRGPWAVFLWGFPDEEIQIQTAHGMGAFGQWARSIAQRSLDDDSQEDMISEAVRNLRRMGVMDSDPAERLWLDSYTLNIVMAGHETTVNTTSCGIVALLRHRDQWQSLIDDPKLIPNAVDEILRHDTGVPTWRQRVIKDIEISGVTIPEGALVYAAINSANRDEDIFENGEDLDVRRTNANRHLAFGKGAHTCMGNHLAKLEIKIMLEELSARLPHMELVPGQKLPYSPNTSQRGPEHVLVRWDPALNPRPEDRP
ncbi:MAG: cytochrome [Conexibacter sp.]|nr:cytochrome [Conexibacter sp.]